MNDQNQLLNLIEPYLPEIKEMIISKDFEKLTSKERFACLTNYTEMRFMIALDKRGKIL